MLPCGLQLHVWSSDLSILELVSVPSKCSLDFIAVVPTHGYQIGTWKNLVKVTRRLLLLLSTENTGKMVFCSWMVGFSNCAILGSYGKICQAITISGCTTLVTPWILSWVMCIVTTILHESSGFLLIGCLWQYCHNQCCNLCPLNLERLPLVVIWTCSYKHAPLCFFGDRYGVWSTVVVIKCLWFCMSFVWRVVFRLRVGVDYKNSEISWIWQCLWGWRTDSSPCFY
jgi:hypothetical protein